MTSPELVAITVNRKMRRITFAGTVDHVLLMMDTFDVHELTKRVSDVGAN